MGFYPSRGQEASSTPIGHSIIRATIPPERGAKNYFLHTGQQLELRNKRLPYLHFEMQPTLADIVYVQRDSGPQCLDVYLPDHKQGHFPVILYLHGGGWNMGSKSNPICLSFVQEGFAVVSIDYRLSDVAVFPAQILDCRAAIRRIRRVGVNFSLDADHIIAWGISAGGHLAALLGTTAHTTDWSDDEEVSSLPCHVDGVVDFFGPTDLLRLYDDISVPGRRQQNPIDSPESRLLGGQLSTVPELAKMASPLFHVHADCPPFLIIHGERDDIVPVAQSRRLHHALENIGVPTRLLTFPNAGHGFKPSERQEAMVAVKQFLSVLLSID